MSTRNGMPPRMARIAVRLSESEEKAVREAAKAKGYTSPSAFICAAIRNEMDGRSEWTDFEQRLAAGMDRTNEEVSRVGRGQQAVLALLDALTKTVLTCIPEPPVDARPKRWRERVSDTTGWLRAPGVAGDGQAAIRELVTDAASQG